MRKEFLSSLIIIPPLLAAPRLFDQKMTFYLRDGCERFLLNFHSIIFTLGLVEMKGLCWHVPCIWWVTVLWENSGLVWINICMLYRVTQTEKVDLTPINPHSLNTNMHFWTQSCVICLFPIVHWATNKRLETKTELMSHRWVPRHAISSKISPHSLFSALCSQGRL